MNNPDKYQPIEFKVRYTQENGKVVRKISVFVRNHGGGREELINDAKTLSEAIERFDRML